MLDEVGLSDSDFGFVELQSFSFSGKRKAFFVESQGGMSVEKTPENTWSSFGLLFQIHVGRQTLRRAASRFLDSFPNDCEAPMPSAADFLRQNAKARPYHFSPVARLTSPTPPSHRHGAHARPTHSVLSVLAMGSCRQTQPWPPRTIPRDSFSLPCGPLASLDRRFNPPSTYGPDRSTTSRKPLCDSVFSSLGLLCNFTLLSCYEGCPKATALVLPHRNRSKD